MILSKVKFIIAGLIIPQFVWANEHIDRLACIGEAVVLTNVVMEDSGYGQHQFYADVTNNLDWAISGIGVNFVVRSEGRSVSWLEDRGFQSIAGGVEPGETRERIFITSKSLPRDTPDDVVVGSEVIDVADPKGNQYINEVNVLGGSWTNEMTELECQK